MSGSLWIAVRAFLAIVLMILFYVLALGIVAFLLWTAYMDLQSSRIHLRYLLFAAIGSGAILYSILPRMDRFVAPGPQLDATRHARLFELIARISRETHQAMPEEVYAIPDANAWVTQRGGMMGFGSRRVMGLGLPLMQSLTVGQLHGVLAHEFGHYHGGDTMLGPWVYKTRGALVRTLHHVGQTSSILSIPFNLFSKVYLRITQAVARRQELNADTLAAGIVGKEVFASGLKQVHATGLAYNAYLSQCLLPVLSNGLQPPVLAGFQHFLSAEGTRQALEEFLESEARSSRTNPYDTHPSLADRLTHLRDLDVPASVAPNLASEPAIALVTDAVSLEQHTFVPLDREGTPVAVDRIGWEELPSRLLIPDWRKAVAQLESLQGKTIEELAELARAPVEKMAPKAVDDHCRLLGAALALALHDAGWNVDSQPGERLTCQRTEGKIEPFHVVRQLAQAEMDESEWQRQIAALGIAKLPLRSQSEAPGSSNAPHETPPQP